MDANGFSLGDYDLTLGGGDEFSTGGASVGTDYSFGLGELSLGDGLGGLGGGKASWMDTVGDIVSTVDKVADTVGGFFGGGKQETTTEIQDAQASVGQGAGLMDTLTAPSPVAGLPWWLVGVGALVLFKVLK